MPRSRYKPEEIVSLLRRAEVPHGPVVEALMERGPDLPEGQGAPMLAHAAALGQRGGDGFAGRVVAPMARRHGLRPPLDRAPRARRRATLRAFAHRALAHVAVRRAVASSGPAAREGGGGTSVALPVTGRGRSPGRRGSG